MEISDFFSEYFPYILFGVILLILWLKNRWKVKKEATKEEPPERLPDLTSFDTPYLDIGFSDANYMEENNLKHLKEQLNFVDKEIEKYTQKCEEGLKKFKEFQQISKKYEIYLMGLRKQKKLFEDLVSSIDEEE